MHYIPYKKPMGGTSRRGFTIVELLIVVVVIAILAAITIVSYNGISNRAKQSSAESGASQAAKKVLTYATTNSDTYPVDLSTAGITTGNGTVFEYSVNNTANPKTFCVTATVGTYSYYVSESITTPTSGLCAGHSGGASIANGALIQTVGSGNCPATRTRVIDARDNHTYWVQKLADNKCWMLTNLGYAGGGTNTYSDTKTLSNGTADGATTFTAAKYYIPTTGSNVTTEPTAPSTSTDGGATNPQYGYLYNWCAATGAQLSSSGCSSSITTPLPNTSQSICPAGWRLPVGNGGDFDTLNTAINGGSTSTDAGLRTAWLAQRSGDWYSGFGGQVSVGYYWSASQYSANGAYALTFSGSSLSTPYYDGKDPGFAVRCIAN